MPALSITTTIELKGGTVIPQLGIGCFESPQNLAVTTVLAALQLGYRHLDTAQSYRNEAEVGQAVRESGIPREEIFVTTKLQTHKRNKKVDPYLSLLGSLDKIDLGYVDLILIHSPHGGPEERREKWEALERLKREGKVKAIGVSNYGVSHLQELEKYATEAITVNQLELHPFLQQKPIVQYCQQKGIAIQAYCPLLRGYKADHEVLNRIALEVGKTWPQVLLRWSLQKGYIPLPKSDKLERIIANADLYDFELSTIQIEDLDVLDEGYHCTWDPVNEP